MGFFSGMFGKNSPFDGSKFIAENSGIKFWHNGFIDKDEAIAYGQQFAYQIDPLGARRRSQDVVTLMGELIFYFQLCESAHDETALKHISYSIKEYIKKYEGTLPLGVDTSYFIAHTNYRAY